MSLDEKTMRLIAIGASIGANCQPCLQINTDKALELGANVDDISRAIWVGKMVRQGAASKMDQLITDLSQDVSSAVTRLTEGCGCN